MSQKHESAAAKAKFYEWAEKNPLASFIVDILDPEFFPIPFTIGQLILIDRADVLPEQLPTIPNQHIIPLTQIMEEHPEIDINSLEFRSIYWDTISRYSRARRGLFAFPSQEQ